jgi:hypothetical protein
VLKDVVLGVTVIEPAKSVDAEAPAVEEKA